MTKAKVATVATGERRLLKLARFLRGLQDGQFKFDVTREDGNMAEYRRRYCGLPAPEGACGTLACAVGWMPEALRGEGLQLKPVMENGSLRGFGRCDNEGRPKDWHWVARNVFGLKGDQVSQLFSPGERRPWARGNILDGRSSAAKVAASIEAFVAYRRRVRKASRHKRLVRRVARRVVAEMAAAGGGK